MMNRRTQRSALSVKTLLAGILACTLGGCTSTLPPTFTADGIRELESFDERTRVVFLTNAENPNREPIPLEQITYSVSLDGEAVYSGVRSPETTLPGYSSLLFELPAIVGSGVLSSGRDVQYAIDGSVKYHVPGAFAEVLYDADIKVPEAPMKIEGTINLGAKSE